MMMMRMAPLAKVFGNDVPLIATTSEESRSVFSLEEEKFIFAWEDI
jgi:hypothetical protein